MWRVIGKRRLFTCSFWTKLCKLTHNLICFFILTYLFQTLFLRCFSNDFWHYILIREVIWVRIKLICWLVVFANKLCGDYNVGQKCNDIWSIFKQRIKRGLLESYKWINICVVYELAVMKLCFLYFKFILEKNFYQFEFVNMYYLLWILLFENICAKH
jgi:hypothetical protein